MDNISQMKTEKPQRPIKAIQFGEGNFLRAFVDYMIDILNEKTDFNGNIVIIKPIKYGSVEQFGKQNNLYTVLLRGLVNGEKTTEKRIITDVEKAISCFDQYDEYASLAKCETLRFVISNTTEAGIVFDKEDKFDLCPPESYPGKLTKFLFERYMYFSGDKDKGLIILPVELIDDNGNELRYCVKSLSRLWNLPEGFVQWLDDACVFASTLVDRIVTGYPREEAEEIFAQIGYEDKLLVTGEPFALWVIEADRDISDEIPFVKAGLPVIFTDNHKPYKQRKVRVLNGAHTSFVLASYLAGNDFVGQSMEDEIIREFMNSTIFDEIIPTLDLPEDDVKSFANAVIDRFKNPFIKHSLLAISLNSVSKWKARCMPSFLKYIELNGKLPPHLTFSLASLIAFYNGKEITDGALKGTRNGIVYDIKDDKAVLEFFAENSSLPSAQLAQEVLANESFWGVDLSKQANASEQVASYLKDIRTLGMRNAIEKNFR